MGLSLPTAAKGALTLSLGILNILFCFIPIIVIALLKLVVPVQGWRDLTSRWLMAVGEQWISNNKTILGMTQAIRWDIRGAEHLRRREWHLVISNHRSSVDILVLQTVFNRRIPFLKFFIKQELIWVPFLGLAWWALDMPFMKRYSREFLAKHPELQGRDLGTTRAACEKFRRVPTSVFNFVEGTRFTPEKQAARVSSYRHLLPPRAGGVGFVLGAMGGILHSLLDVTIVYDGLTPSLWDLCCGRVSRIVIHVNERKIEDWLTEGDYATDEVFRDRFQQRLAGVWREKDELITSILQESSD
jgi:1-acyl-sn-glycerol-3-phosphate acyltransferase